MFLMKKAPVAGQPFGKFEQRTNEILWSPTRPNHWPTENWSSHQPHNLNEGDNGQCVEHKQRKLDKRRKLTQNNITGTQKKIKKKLQQKLQTAIVMTKKWLTTMCRKRIRPHFVTTTKYYETLPTNCHSGACIFPLQNIRFMYSLAYRRSLLLRYA